MFAQILTRWASIRGFARRSRQQFTVVRLLKAIGLQVLVTDEVHNILPAPPRDSGSFLTRFAI